jgi:hypothetical protein
MDRLRVARCPEPASGQRHVRATEPLTSTIHWPSLTAPPSLAHRSQRQRSPPPSCARGTRSVCACLPLRRRAACPLLETSPTTSLLAWTARTASCSVSSPLSHFQCCAAASPNSTRSSLHTQLNSPRAVAAGCKSGLARASVSLPRCTSRAGRCRSLSSPPLMVPTCRRVTRLHVVVQAVAMTGAPHAVEDCGHGPCDQHPLPLRPPPSAGTVEQAAVAMATILMSLRAALRGSTAVVCRRRLLQPHWTCRRHRPSSAIGSSRMAKWWGRSTHARACQQATAMATSLGCSSRRRHCTMMLALSAARCALSPPSARRRMAVCSPTRSRPLAYQHRRPPTTGRTFTARG